jgi:hypothetical protein
MMPVTIFIFISTSIFHFFRLHLLTGELIVAAGKRKNRRNTLEINMWLQRLKE